MPAAMVSLSLSPSNSILSPFFHSLADYRRTLSRPFPTTRLGARLLIEPKAPRPHHYVLSPARVTRDVTNLFSITLTVSSRALARTYVQHLRGPSRHRKLVRRASRHEILLYPEIFHRVLARARSPRVGSATFPLFLLCRPT